MKITYIRHGKIKITILIVLILLAATLGAVGVGNSVINT